MTSRSVCDFPLPGGYVIDRYGSLDSTNKEAARVGAPFGKVVLAASQTEGKGRKGRVWHSPPGNLYMTICTEVPNEEIAVHLSFVASLAVFDTIKALVPVSLPKLKWPNDVLIKNRKLSGILIEGLGKKSFLVGLGVNLVSSPPEQDVRYPATDLKSEFGKSFKPNFVCSAVCNRFDFWYRCWLREGFRKIKASWLSSAHEIGDNIKVSDGKDIVEGRFVGLDDFGSLILEGPDSRQYVITAGDVILSRSGYKCC